MASPWRGKSFRQHPPILRALSTLPCSPSAASALRAEAASCHAAFAHTAPSAEPSPSPVLDLFSDQPPLTLTLSTLFLFFIAAITVYIDGIMYSFCACLLKSLMKGTFLRAERKSALGEAWGQCNELSSVSIYCSLIPSLPSSWGQGGRAGNVWGLGSSVQSKGTEEFLASVIKPKSTGWC